MSDLMDRCKVRIFGLTTKPEAPFRVFDVIENQ